MASARGGQGRLDVVDAFRGVAVASVVAFHFTVALARPLFPTNGYHYDGAFPGWLEVGRYGVHVFFVISGLVIALTLSRSSTALEFAGRRFARIYPAFFVAAALALVMTVALGPPFGPGRIEDYLASLTLAAPHLGRRWIDESYWTLLVEAKFYIVAGLSYAWLGRGFWKGVIGYGLAVAALAAVKPWSAHVWLFSDLVPFFLIGIGAWLIGLERRWTPGAICLAVGALLLVYYNLAFQRTCSFQGECLHIAPDWVAWVYLAASVGGLLVLLAAGVRAGFGPLTWVGRISYSLYLVHALTGLWVIRTLKALHASDLAALAGAIAVSLAAASLMFFLVEQPGNRLLLKLQKRLAARPRRGPVGAREA